MAKFTTLSARCVPVNQNNIDTDQIIPARFLKGTSKVGLGEKLFYDWRYDKNDQPRPEFTLNQPAYQEAQILVAPNNLGCGSSREHAPWAIKDYGIKAMIAISFADIFKNNSLKNQLLPITLPEPVVLKLLSDIECDPTLQITVDLPSQKVTIPGQGEFPFEIDSYRKKCLVDDLDDVGFTLSYMDTVQAYEAEHIAYSVK